MSTIGEMFEKDICRIMNPVIKVSDQSDESVIFQELDEYVVTQEIDENLEKFYKDLIERIKKNNDAIGVWISGDFGSGKSHFIKILSFILKNSIISEKKSVDYFQKKVSPSVFSYMQAMSRKSVETILFDIDAESKGGQDADNLVQIYLMVFNRMIGLSTVASVAQMERHMIEEGKYDLFKSKYLEIAKKEWDSDRTKPAFIKGKIEAALVAAGLYEREEAKAVAKTATERFDISVKEFVALVKQYCDSKDDDYVLFFLVDEVGQFISGNTQLMLKLQTITEELGVACRGRVWNVVTSQEDVDSIVSNINYKDYSKIQGRFSIRIKMSSSDVKEVIEKRILLKKKNYVDELQAYYESNRDAIHNKLNFDNNVN
ncbi:MAG: BREX system P-loop protein BrxC, partial [Lachnoclostridium sp.]|nr:BREX system P-loop protein BrxC [Lachnoclostridium sp.]